MDLQSIYRYAGRGFHTDPHLVSLDRDDDDADIAIDDNFFTHPAGQNQHDLILLQ
jgi:hypothetical protein